MDYPLDEVDRRILYHLVSDARNTTAPLVADEVDVSPGTIRNRIEKLEAAGIVRGYHADVDYERADGLLRNLYVCSVPVADRERIVREILDVSGVVSVRETMAGMGNVHVTAVGADTTDLQRIATGIADLGAEIRNEELIVAEHHQPYEGYGAGEMGGEYPGRDYLSLTGDAEIAEIRITERAPVAGMRLDDADREGLLGEDVLVVVLERDDEVVTPRGDTVFRPGDVANVLFREGYDESVIDAFGGDVVRR